MPSELDRLAAVRRSYADLAPRVVSGEPWPLATAFGTEPEAAWGPRELLAHVAEMLPYWLGELERVVDGDPGALPVPFGRVVDDVVRIGSIERDRTLPLRVLFGRVDLGLRAWADRLGSLTGDERGRIGRHPKLGEMPASAIPERFIVGHAEDHVTQLEQILADAAVDAR
jgi:hypothetical protein